MIPRRSLVVTVIGATQTIAWASGYYMPAILGAPVAHALHLPASLFFALFSGALLLSALVGPVVGRLIDHYGGRLVLAVSNVVLAAGLAALGAAHGIVGLTIAWVVLGLGLGMGLYDPAFATLTWLYGREARAAITGITLIAGFASTIGWPASALFLDHFGWRWACLIWAGLNLFLAGPVNLLLIPRRGLPPARPRPTAEIREVEPPRGAMPILAFFFSASWFVQGAMAAHLPGLLMTAGASPTAAIAAAAMVGPAQVGSRIVEFGLLRSVNPVISARIAAVLHPIGAGFLVAFGGPAVAAFAVLHGAGNGMITIAKGTLPLSLFGPYGYGRRSGLLSAPARVSQSAAPFLFGLLLDHVGTSAVYLSAGLSLAAFASLFALRSRATAVAASSAARSG
ncbi:MAG TPA: MFS transporter [Stellaceae bacterium]|nr:MFS transporter [Stellaceae bacterium]